MQKANQLFKRYQRQTLLPEFGIGGQYKLLSASVLVIGAGGLGCPVLTYLAAAGVGTIGIADHDRVNLTNLHRQVLYGMDDIGKPKAVVAVEKLKSLNPELQYLVFHEAVDNSNIIHMMKEFDVVVDGTDNFATRYLINDACVLMSKPLIFGAISRFEGQVAVFNVPTGKDGVCIHYRDLFPHPPKYGEVLNCAEAGVLGVLPGIIGTMMANEVIKLLTGMGNSLSGSLLTYNAISNETMKWQLSKNSDSDALVPATVADLHKHNYAWECGLPEQGLEIDSAEVEDLLKSGEEITLIDVREPGEIPALTRWPHEQIPLGKLMTGGASLKAKSIVFICQSGKRSLTAAKWAKENFTEKKVFSVRGGVLGLEG
jgi:sulfur-carrier protein adenylyltransferase/sulfurtransferase